MGYDKIIVRGARQHNLKNIDVELPRNKLIVITGLSGSGKSTLAFDTLYAEGQRRYVESLSTYARQFLERMDKPDVDIIEGLSPAIAIEQKTASHNPRSTVGTVTEIFDYLRLLYSTTGTPHCYICQKPITAQSLDQITDKIMSLPEGSKITILSPLVSGQKGSYEKLLKQLRKNGFSRVRIDGKIYEIEETEKLDKNIKHTIDVIIDRLVIKKTIRNRLADSLELAISQSDGLVTIDVQGEGPILFSEKSACITCGISYPEFTPASFSFNSPQGACSKCDGLGTTPEFDPDLIIPNKDLSLRQGAVAIWANRSSIQFNEFLDGLTKHYNVNIYTPYKDLPEDFKNILLYGSGNEQINFYFEQNNRRLSYNKAFEGIIPKLQRQYIESESNQTREEIREYMIFHPCPECKGARLNKASRSVRVANTTISEIAALSISKASAFFKNLKLEGKKEVIAKRVIKEIQERLAFLENVGLSYLTLDRSAYTLSGGESQRIRLATQIGSKLTGVLYVLDEPSIGLHQRDNQKLLSTLLRMRDLGNTVLVVEHDEETILSADFVIDMGPGAGVNGGNVVFSGTPEMLVNDINSLTGQYLSGRKQIDVPQKRRNGNSAKIIIKGASENNL
ncbi:MAG: excinuclease ABC subunit A, partial [Desulfobacterium sp.]|nr:excinuclease ABC subunit A [Desulfobacterium sp.]